MVVSSTVGLPVEGNAMNTAFDRVRQ